MPKDDMDDTGGDMHREHNSSVSPILPDVFFIHIDLAFEGQGLIAPGDLDKYEVDNC